MKLSQLKDHLKNLDQIIFELPNGEQIPNHFHVTELGKISKNFIDCGGTVRKEEVVNFQLWEANDYDHRLAPEKLQKIIALSEEILDIHDGEIEVEYQAGTIGKFGLEFQNGILVLTNKQTDCLAKDNCGVPSEKPRLSLNSLQSSTSCAPGSGCC
tara:strand:- start:1675 stop:2142 length:468 start_codon:yes stop_codon:yes gene_type:complete